MRKLIQIKDLYTKSFPPAKSFLDCPFIGFAQEYIYKKTNEGYRAWLKELLTRHDNVWGYIKTDEDVEARIIKFDELIESLQNYGYCAERSEELYVKDGLIYGDLTVYVEDGKYYLIDGHHRTAICYALGLTELSFIITK